MSHYKNSPKFPFWHFSSAFVHSKWKRSSLRSQCWMRLFLWFSNTVYCCEYVPICARVPSRESLLYCIEKVSKNSTSSCWWSPKPSYRFGSIYGLLETSVKNGNSETANHIDFSFYNWTEKSIIIYWFACSNNYYAKSCRSQYYIKCNWMNNVLYSLIVYFFSAFCWK